MPPSIRFTSEPTLHYVARERHVGVIPLFNRKVTLPKWQRLGQLMSEYQQRDVRRKAAHALRRGLAPYVDRAL